MNKAFDYQGKRVLVIGMARSGIQVARLLAGQGAVPILNDLKPREAFGDVLDVLNGLNVEWRLGEDPVPLLDQADALVISPGVPIDSPAVLEAQKRGIDRGGKQGICRRGGTPSGGQGGKSPVGAQ